MNLTAVSISRDNAIDWKVSEIPLVVNTKSFKQFPRDMSRERIEYLAERRNEVHKMALAQYVDTTHFMMIDSYYTNQVESIRKLIKEYKTFDNDVILGGSNWYIDKSMFPSRKRYWDTWTTPEARNFDYRIRGEVLVKGVGGVVIYPSYVWEKQSYAVPEPFPESGCEMNHLCRYPLPVLLSFNVKFFHPTPRNQLEKPFSHRLRTRLALGRLR